MAVTTIARIQHRRGVKSDLPANLNEGELGWCMDTFELFIGNSAAVGGNTQILTSSSNLATIAQYTFVSDTSVVSQTGPSAAQPVIRSLQNQIDDYWVNVKAYGAVGDGITDDTAAINRAIFDLYTKILPTSENENQTRKALWFPSGVYLITTPLLIYPQVRLVGENAASTKILLDNVVAQPCVAKLVDSLGQEDSSIGDNGAQLPTNITIDNLTLATANTIDVLLLQRCDGVNLSHCMLQGNWNPGDPVILNPTAAIRVQTLGSAIETKNINVVDTTISNIMWAAYSTDEVENWLFDRCVFSQLFKGILTEEILAPDPNANSGPLRTRIANSLFDTIDDYGIQVMSSNPGVALSNNTFVNVGVTSAVSCVYWDAVSTECQSIGDRFDTVNSIDNNGTNNFIVNAGSYRSVRVPTGSSPYSDAVQSADEVLIIRTGTEVVTILLPPGQAGRSITIKDGENNAAANNITIQPDGTDAVNVGGAGAAYTMSTNNQSVTLVYDSTLTRWHLV